jgi:hypothetical protein
MRAFARDYFDVKGNPQAFDALMSVRTQSSGMTCSDVISPGRDTLRRKRSKASATSII